MPANPRVRTNNVFGTTTDNPLTNVATTMNSAGLANLAAVATQHAVITLDPLRVSGAPEYVIVTAHTGSATSATITRGAYGSVARQHPLGTLWTHASVTDDFIRIVDATGDITDPYEGQLIYEQDTDIYWAYTGAAWIQLATIGAWSTYAPTNTNITVGNGTQAARWTRFGRTVHVAYSLVWGSTTSYGGDIQVGMPVAAGAGVNAFVGSAEMFDSGTASFAGVCRLAGGGSAATVIAADGAGDRAVDATNPMTWATGDTLRLSITYEAAS